jgi:multidrug resistance protein MdtO
MRIALWKYRAQVPGFELPESVRLRQQEYDEHSAQMLEEMADRIENNTQHTSNGVDSRELFSRTLDAVEREQPAQLPTGRAQMFVELLRGIDALTTSLASEIARGI